MITEGEPARKLSRLQEYCGGGDDASSAAASPPPGGRDSNDSNASLVVSEHPSSGLRPTVSMEEDSCNSEMSVSRATTPTGSLIWQHGAMHNNNNNSNNTNTGDDDDLHSLPNSMDLTTHLQRKEVFNARKQREFIPDNKKDESYWDRRRRNNEAAKRSREKRRLNDMVLETRVIELTKENALLRAQLNAIRDKFGIVGDATEVQVALPPAEHQMALNLTKRAKLLTPLMGGAMLASSGQSAAALRSLVVHASSLQQHHQQQHQQQQQQQASSLRTGALQGGKTYLGAGGGGGGSTNNARMLLSSHGGAAVSDVNDYWPLRDDSRVYLSANAGNPVSHQQQNGHHEHQGALLSALNGNGHQGGYSPYGQGRASPPSNGYHHVPLALIAQAAEYQHRPLAAHQGHFRNGYALPAEHQRLSAAARDSRNGHSASGDECCSSSGSSCDEAATDRERCLRSPSEVLDVEGCYGAANGAAVADTQMHLPHKLRHKPRLSECSAPALSPPSLGTTSPPAAATNGHSDASGNHRQGHEYPDESTSGDERENRPVEDSDAARRRKRKSTIYGEPPSGEALQELRCASDHLETENTQLKMEMQRLAVEVASLKDLLICNKDGNGANGAASATCRGRRNEAGSGFAADWGRESESGCA